ncbi:MAG TPA: sialate O-acetylesterase [Marinagarivorans sp.]
MAGLAALPFVAQAAPDPNFHIYLALGQSNMQGTASIEAQDRGINNPRVQTLQSENGCAGQSWTYGQWRTAEPPQIRCNQEGGLGPADTFAHTMAANTGDDITIGIVGGAYGGAKIEYFLPECGSDCAPPFGGISGAPNNGTGGYQWVLDLAKKAQEAGVIKGIIFHQGESNSGQQNWPSLVNQYITALRRDLGISAADLPFIAGELPYTGCCSGHNSLVRQLTNVVENGHVVTAEGGLNDKGDGLHWNSAAVREMGRRYAAKMLTLVDTNSGPVDCGTQDGSPICCNISADPDGDGWGTQNDNQMCLVTPETDGYIPPNPDDVIAAINVGGQGVSFDGVYYQADTDFAGGMPNSTSDAVAGSDGSALFQSERYGDFSYEIDMPNGPYDVTLDLVELYWDVTASRVFSIAIEGTTVIENIDLVSEVGHDVAWQAGPFATQVNDGSLTIEVSGSTDNGTLSGILVRTGTVASSSSAASSSSTAPPSSSSMAVVSSSASVSSSAATVSSESVSSSSATSSSTASEPVKIGSTNWFFLLAMGLFATFCPKFRVPAARD